MSRRFKKEKTDLEIDQEIDIINEISDEYSEDSDNPEQPEEGLPEANVDLAFKAFEGANKVTVKKIDFDQSKFQGIKPNDPKIIISTNEVKSTKLRKRFASMS